MIVVYSVILALGGAFLTVALSASPVQIRTLVQSLIFILLGGGGLAISLRGR